jgi:hypothetical protein
VPLTRWIGVSARRIADRWDPQPTVALVLEKRIDLVEGEIRPGLGVVSSSPAGDRVLQSIRDLQATPVVSPASHLHITAI